MAAGDGPLLYGIADGILTLAEIEEYIESVPSTKRDTPAIEHVSRSVQVIGSLGKDRETEYQQTRVILPTFREDVGHIIWIYNTGPTMTTGAIINMRGRYFGRWLD